MSIPAIKDFSDYDQYSGEANATTDAEMQEYMGNQNLVLKALADKLWQPSTAYVVGQFVHSPNMEAGVAAVCITDGTSSNTEPDWISYMWGGSNSSVAETIIDGTVEWMMVGTVRSVNEEMPDKDGNVRLPEMYGANSSQAGISGLVPTPPAGSQNKALCGDGKFKALVDLVYPVGSLYWSKKSTDPSTLFGGTWTRVKDKFILAAGDSYAQGATGGAATVALTTAQMPAHSHTRGTMNITGWANTGAQWWSGQETLCSGALSVSYNSSGYRNEGGAASKERSVINLTASNNWTGSTSSVGSGSAHENMPPYVTYYCWERTA